MPGKGGGNKGGSMVHLSTQDLAHQIVGKRGGAHGKLNLNKGKVGSFEEVLFDIK